MPEIAAGWYTDPSGSGEQRWWDGAGWTTHRRPRSVPPLDPGTASGASGQVLQPRNDRQPYTGAPSGYWSSESQLHTYQRPPARTGLSKQTKILLGVVAATLAIVVAIVVFATSGNSQQGIAKRQCKDHVLDHLVSPATTKFVGDLTTTPSGFDGGYEKAQFSAQAPDVRADSITKVWAVGGSFDTQNRSGATVRGTFSCKAFFIGDEFIATIVTVNGR